MTQRAEGPRAASVDRAETTLSSLNPRATQAGVVPHVLEPRVQQATMFAAGDRGQLIWCLRVIPVGPLSRSLSLTGRTLGAADSSFRVRWRGGAMSKGAHGRASDAIVPHRRTPPRRATYLPSAKSLKGQFELRDFLGVFFGENFVFFFARGRRPHRRLISKRY